MLLKPRKAFPFIILFLYYLIINYLVFLSPFNYFEVDNVSAISTVNYQASSADQPELLSDENWQVINLPDDWYHSQHEENQLWYRATVDVPHVSEKIWSVYLPAVTHNAAVYINGIWVGQGGHFQEASESTQQLSRHHNQPLLFNFSSTLLQHGENVIDIRVATTFHQQGQLDKFYLAPANMLEHAYSFKHFIRVDIMHWVTITMYMMAFIIFAFWLARPQDTIYGLFSLELFFWATHNLNLIVTNIPFPVRIWEAMTMSTLGWTVIAMILFNHRYLGETHPRTEKVMMLFAIFGVGLFLLPDLATILSIGYGVWDSFLLIFGSYAVFFLLRSYYKNKNHDVFLMLLAGIPILVFGFHDILVVNHHWNRLDGLIIQYSVIPAAILFSWFLLRRFIQSINRAEDLAATLERRVEQKQQALQEQYEQLNQLEKRQVLAEERERIMRDMHDGIGGQLVSLITMMRGLDGDLYTKLREKVQHSLADLRFVIDSLDPVLDDLPTLLGMMRRRLKEQLETEEIDLEWAVTDLPEVSIVSPRNSLHIMRIVQEAVTNGIKHARTSKMKLTTGTIENGTLKQIFIDIIDYGRGLNDSENFHLGRGLENMTYRAQQLGGELIIDSSQQGTRVRLLLNY